MLRLDALPPDVNPVGQLLFSTTPPPSASGRSARTARRSRPLGPRPACVGRQKTTPPPRRATAASTGRPAPDERRTETPVRSSSDPRALPPTPPWPSRPPRSVAASYPCLSPKNWTNPISDSTQRRGPVSWVHYKHGLRSLHGPMHSGPFPAILHHVATDRGG